MDEHIINSAIGNKLCWVKAIDKGFYRVRLDGTLAGYIRKDDGGWML